MDARLKRIKELFSESEKRNGELAHKNFELKKRIAELEETDIVHCRECKHKLYCSHIDILDAYNSRGRGEYIDIDSWFCADGERKE